jgi:hypothetical protein
MIKNDNRVKCARKFSETQRQSFVHIRAHSGWFWLVLVSIGSVGVLMVLVLVLVLVGLPGVVVLMCCEMTK